MTATLRAIAGPDLVTLHTPAPIRGEDLKTVAEFEVASGETMPFVLTHGSSHVAAAGRDRSRSRTGGDRGVLDGMGRAEQVARRVGRSGHAIAHRAQGAHLRADGRPRRGADDIAPGAARRNAELGLPVLLAARCHAHAARADERGLLRRSARLARLAAARRGRRAGAAADHVWPGRGAAAAGVRDSVAARLRELRRRCASATPRTISCSSTSTAR